MIIVPRLALAAVVLMLARLAPASEQVRRWQDAANRAVAAGEYDRALAAYDRVLKYTQPAPPVYERLVQIGLELRRVDDARLYLFALADLDGWTAPRYEQLRTIDGIDGAREQAAGPFVPDEDDPAGLRALAQQQIRQLAWAQARDTLERLIALVPDNHEALFYLGTLWAPHDRARAAEYLVRAEADLAWTGRAQAVRALLAVYEQSALTDAHTALGITLVGLGEWSLAEQALVMALEANAVNPSALAYLGFVRDQQGRDGGPDLQAALDMAPHDPTLYYLWGQHWRLAGDHQAAYQAFSQAYWLSPDNPALAAEIGNSLRYLGDLAGAQEWLRIAITLAPDDVRWYALLAAFYADTGFLLDDTGLSFIEQASARAPYDSSIRASLGWAYYQTGDLAQAREQLAMAVGMNPSDARGWYYYAVVLERLGDRRAAIEAYRVVVQQLGLDRSFGILAARAIQRLGDTP